MQIKPSEFWDLTPAELRSMGLGRQEKNKSETINLLFAAWHQAMWTRCDPKQFPKWESVVKRYESAPIEKKPQTPEQMANMMAFIALTSGGKIIVKDSAGE